MTRRVAAAVALAACTVASAPPALAESQPRDHYLLHCSGCHGADGRGVPGTVPSLHELAPVFEAKGGREYLARVPGVAQAPLNDADLARLLSWVLTEFSGASMQTPYSPNEVGHLRARPLRDPAAARPLRPAR